LTTAATQSQDWVRRSLRSVWHPCTQMQHHETVPLVPVSHGRGAWLYDHDGKRYLDAISSWWVNLFGHANPRINAALKDQLDKLEHAMLAGFTHEPVVQLSEQLSALTDRRAGPLLLRVGWRVGGRDRAEDELPRVAQRRPDRQAGIRLSEGQLSRRNRRRAGVTDVALFKDAYGPLLRARTWSRRPMRAMRSRAKAPPMLRAARRRIRTPAARTRRQNRRDHRRAAGAMRHRHGDARPVYLSRFARCATSIGVHLIAR
jgi:adenosylmethionine-8-amino-7-oxononanoate aminotransferase